MTVAYTRVCLVYKKLYMMKELNTQPFMEFIKEL